LRSSGAVSSFSRLSSNRMPTLRRAWLSASAWRTQGVSSSITAFRSSFFSSGLSSAGGLPLVEHAADLADRIGDVPGQRWRTAG
jgi:hypothetical protein